MQLRLFDEEPTARPPLASHHAIDDLASYPNVSPALLAHHASLIGQAGAAVVDSTLLARGIPTLPAPDGQSYDRIVLIRGQAVTLQIKTTSHPGLDGRYRWQISCGYRGSPRGRRPYPRASFQIIACVVLPAHGVLFTPAGPPRIALHARDLPSVVRDPLVSLDEALEAIGIESAVPTP